MASWTPGLYEPWEVLQAKFPHGGRAVLDDHGEACHPHDPHGFAAGLVPVLLHHPVALLGRGAGPLSDVLLAPGYPFIATVSEVLAADCEELL